MNRRNFLRSMAVISASGLSLLALRRVAAETPQGALRDMLNQSEPVCEFLLQASTSLENSQALHVSVQELSQLIPVAKLRLDEGSRFSAAFWQSCSDAFLRTAGQVESLKTQTKLHASLLCDAQELFEQTAYVLNSQTVAAVEFGSVPTRSEN